MWLKRLERIEDHPDFLTLRQIPKAVSKIIDKTAIKISGLTGDRIANAERMKIDILDFIKKPL